MKIHIKVSFETMIFLFLITFLLIFIACYEADPPLRIGFWDIGKWDLDVWGN